MPRESKAVITAACGVPCSNVQEHAELYIMTGLPLLYLRGQARCRPALLLADISYACDYQLQHQVYALLPPREAPVCPAAHAFLPTTTMCMS